MRRIPLVLVVLGTVAFGSGGARPAEPVDNPRIDAAAYLAVAAEATALRESRRVSETEFLALSAEPGTIVLDARSREKFAELHVRGAINLPFPDLAVESLARTIPDRSTRILIYCNNNFSNAEGPFPTKLADASLNVPTYVALYSYGYRNVWELGPLVDLAASKLPFEGTSALSRRDPPEATEAPSHTSEMLP